MDVMKKIQAWGLWKQKWLRKESAYPSTSISFPRDKLLTISTITKGIILVTSAVSSQMFAKELKCGSSGTLDRITADQIKSQVTNVAQDN